MALIYAFVPTNVIKTYFHDIYFVINNALFYVFYMCNKNLRYSYLWFKLGPISVFLLL